MDNGVFITKCEQLVRDYTEHLDDSDTMPDFSVYPVWITRTLQNNKGLFSTTISDGMYYEITYNGDKDEFYFDAYKKLENKCLKGATI